MIHTSTQAQPLPAIMLIASGVALLVGAVSAAGSLAVIGVPVLIGGSLAFAMSALAVTVSAADIELRFRFGWPTKHIPLADVLRASAVRNKWWYGWGIRWIPGGGLWNVWGLDAVELSLAGGRRFRIGTDDPAGLVAVIAAAQGGSTDVDGCWGL